MPEEKKKPLPPMQVHIDLNFPIKVASTDVARLTMRRPKLRDQQAAEQAVADKGGTTQLLYELTLISNLCELSPEELMDLDTADYQKCREVLNEMMSFSR